MLTPLEPLAAAGARPVHLARAEKVWLAGGALARDAEHRSLRFPVGSPGTELEFAL